MKALVKLLLGTFLLVLYYALIGNISIYLHYGLAILGGILFAKGLVNLNPKKS